MIIVFFKIQIFFIKLCAGFETSQSRALSDFTTELENNRAKEGLSEHLQDLFKSFFGVRFNNLIKL